MRRLFLVAATLMFALPGLAALCAFVPIEPVRRLSMSRLQGVTVPAPAPDLSPRAVLDRSFQAKAGPWLAERMGRVREAYIRVDNGIAYLFGRYNVPSIVVGRERTLFERHYIEEFCGGSPAIDAARIAAGVAAAQTRIRAQGKAFVFVVSPSKASVYPELLPEGACAAPAASRNVDRLTAALREAGVSLVHATAVLREARKTQPWPVFPRNGTHWNHLGSVFVAQEVQAEAERQLGRPLPRPVIADMRVDSRPRDDERDLAELLNLPVTLRVYPSPHPVLRSEPPAPPPRMLIVGSSFTWQLIRAFAEAGAMADASKQYFYFSRVLDYRAGRFGRHGPSGQAEGDLPRTLPATDVVVLEANEAALDSPHMAAFSAAVVDDVTSAQAGQDPPLSRLAPGLKLQGNAP